MQVKLKSGEWKEVDTTFLSKNQYDIDGERVFDGDILAVREDARINKGKCRWCGTIVNKGEEEKHFQESESKPCSSCYWLQEQMLNQTQEEKTESSEEDENLILKTIIIKREYRKHCGYESQYHKHIPCAHNECRAYGIEWFTPQNTFFLKYPDGLSSIPMKLIEQNFEIKNELLNARYTKSIGTYTLKGILNYNNGKPIGVEMFEIFNSRHHYKFRYRENTFLICDFRYGWRMTKKLPAIPYDVVEKIKEICNEDNL